MKRLSILQMAWNDVLQMRIFPSVRLIESQFLINEHVQNTRLCVAFAQVINASGDQCFAYGDAIKMQLEKCDNCNAESERGKVEKT